MKNIWIIAMVFFSTCKEVSFKEPQPQGKKALTEIPETLRGKYLLIDDNGFAKDTLFVSSTGYHAGHNPAEQNVLSDSLILKHYKGYYFLSIMQEPEWLLRVIKQDKNGDLIYMAMEADRTRFAAYLGQLSDDIKIDSIQVNGKMLYQIDPSPKQLVALIRKGYFKHTPLKKLN